MQMQHSAAPKVYQCKEVVDTSDDTYNISYVKGQYLSCPVTGCEGGGRDKSGLYRHFSIRHPNADVVIDADGTLPKCTICGLRTANLQKHQGSFTCNQISTRRTHENKQLAQSSAENVQFIVNGKKLQRVREFCYLGRIFTENDDDSKCIQENLRKARKRWASVGKILKTEGANSKVMAKFYLTIVQAVLLYGADSWTIKKRDYDALRSFHRRAVRYMTGQHIRKLNEQWTYPEHEKLLKECGLLDIDIYIARRRGTLKKYLEVNQNELLQTAERTKKHAKDANKILWWNQPCLTKSELNNHSKFWFNK